jgi:fatty acid desaturase
MESDPSYLERTYFETATSTPSWPGCWDVTIGGRTYHAAHHLLDYVKIWDLPQGPLVRPFHQ